MRRVPPGPQAVWFPEQTPRQGLKPGLRAWKLPSLCAGLSWPVSNCPVRGWTRTAREAQTPALTLPPGGWGCAAGSQPSRASEGVRGDPLRGRGHPPGGGASVTPPPAATPRTRACPLRPAASGASGRDRPGGPPVGCAGACVPLSSDSAPAAARPAAERWAGCSWRAGGRPVPAQKPQPSVWTPGPGWVSLWTPTRQGERGGHHVPAPSAHVACLSDSTPRRRSGLSPRAGLAGGRGSGEPWRRAPSTPMGESWGAVTVNGEPSRTQ